MLQNSLCPFLYCSKSRFLLLNKTGAKLVMSHCKLNHQQLYCCIYRYIHSVKLTYNSYFIESLQVLESHYCRGKNITRQYLPSELTIKSLWEQYQGSHDDNLKVKYDYFRNIFDNDYNIGFGSPATDVCSTCLSLKERIKCSRDPQEKDKLKTELNVHKARADAFYKLVKEQKEGEITFSFDCQKNQVIPKIPDQASYYLRQLYIYNFTICEGSSTDPQSKDKVFSYVWLENEYKKGSNQISSAMYHRLLNTDLSGVHTIKVVADGCGGQNKNKIVIGMLSKFLSQDSPPSVKKIMLLFLIVGHSFIPPDRVFGRIESKIKKNTTLLTDKDYVEIFKSCATVIRLGEECPMVDWKVATSETIKEPKDWHFKLRPTKRIILVKTKKGSCIVRGETHYNVDTGVAKSLLKHGKQLKLMNLKPEKEGVAIKKAKLKDLTTLLVKHFTKEWEQNEELNFFKNLFSQREALTDPQEEQDSDIGEINDAEEVLAV